MEIGVYTALVCGYIICSTITISTFLPKQGGRDFLSS